MKPILDMTAGSRMFWRDKHNPLTIFLDKRRETFTITYHNAGREPFDKEIEIEPDIQWDWTKKDLPLPKNQFNLVVFDPPHLLHAGKTSWLARKYGVLDEDWQSQLKQGMDEDVRVLKPYGTLIFKWNDDQIKLADVLHEITYRPLFGDKRSKTHWLVFMKGAEK